MPILINLVATRCIDGDHAMLFRWYNDHVHLLMGCETLQAATLYRRNGESASGAPEYLCLYEFASHAGFLEFEGSDARSRAQAVVRDGWGRTGIEIIQRTQFERLGRFAGAATDSVYQVAILSLGPAPASDIARWMNDRVHASGGDAPGERAWHRAWGANDAGGDALVLAQAGEAPAGGAAFDAGQGGRADLDFGTRPVMLRLRWQAAYRRLRRWER